MIEDLIARAERYLSEDSSATELVRDLLTEVRRLQGIVDAGWELSQGGEKAMRELSDTQRQLHDLAAVVAEVEHVLRGLATGAAMARNSPLADAISRQANRLRQAQALREQDEQ